MQKRRLLVPAQRIGLSLVRIWQELDLGRGVKPRQSHVIDPFAGGKIQDSPNNLQALIDRAGGDAITTALRDPGLKTFAMDSIERQTSDVRHQPLQPTDIIRQAAFMLVLQHKFRRGLLEGSSRPDAVNHRLPGLLHQSGEEPFRFLDVSCFSALANSPPADTFVDMPDPAPEEEAGYSFASHTIDPFRGGRPLRLL